VSHPHFKNKVPTSNTQSYGNHHSARINQTTTATIIKGHKNKKRCSATTTTITTTTYIITKIKIQTRYKMRSFLSILFFGFLLSLLYLQNGAVVDARIHAPDEAAAIPVKRQQQRQRSSLLIEWGVGDLLQGSSSHGHRSLGGGVSDVLSTRNLFQQQSWARDDDGNFLWWIWLIIGLSCALFWFVCCCASACCLRD
jgi:hypothetical protein